jgi:bifunctional non-homologous end joining protein LigD
MPLAWPEIASSGEFATTRPSFRVADFADWRARLTKDPWKSIATTNQTIDQSTAAD